MAGIIVLSLLLGAGVGYGVSQMQVANQPLHEAPNPDPVALSGKHTMNSSMSDMLNNLETQSGDARDVNFLEAMIVHHQGAVEMAQVISQSTKRAELKDMAEEIISAQTAEIAVMQRWLREWFGR